MESPNGPFWPFFKFSNFQISKFPDFQISVPARNLSLSRSSPFFKFPDFQTFRFPFQPGIFRVLWVSRFHRSLSERKQRVSLRPRRILSPQGKRKGFGLANANKLQLSLCFQKEEGKGQVRNEVLRQKLVGNFGTQQHDRTRRRSENFRSSLRSGASLFLTSYGSFGALRLSGFQTSETFRVLRFPNFQVFLK